MSKKPTKHRDQKPKSRAQKVEKPGLRRRVLVTFIRFVASSLALAAMVLAIKAPKVTPSQVVLGSSSESVFKDLVVPKVTPVPPEITAKSAIIVSTRKGRVLYSKNPDLKLPPASATKILTAYLAIREFDLDEVVSVPSVCTSLEGSKIGLVPGEMVNVESLLYGMLVASAGDAACTLSTHKFSSSAFIVKMNDLAKEVGLSSTSFADPIGYDNGDQYSTARDLYSMARIAMENGVFRKIVGTKEIVIYSADRRISHAIRSTNQMLFDVPGSLGVKTGTTPKAGEVLVYSYQKGDEDQLIIVVMGSMDRFGDTKRLLKYSLDNYSYL